MYSTWNLRELIVTLTVLLLILSSTSCTKKEDSFYKVVEVNDGDTLTIVTDSYFGVLTKTERVRLIGIDAPELAQEPWGRKAKSHLRRIIKESDWRVKIEFDVQQRDRYGRILAYLWDKNGRMINYLMIRDGYAMVYTVPPNVKYVETLLEAQRIAQREGKGIWGENGLKEKPSDWRKEHRRG